MHVDSEAGQFLVQIEYRHRGEPLVFTERDGNRVFAPQR